MTWRVQTVCGDVNLKCLFSKRLLAVRHVTTPPLPVSGSPESQTPGRICTEGGGRECFLPLFCSASWTHLRKQSASLKRFPPDAADDADEAVPSSNFQPLQTTSTGSLKSVRLWTPSWENEIALDLNVNSFFLDVFNSFKMYKKIKSK